MNYLIKFYDKNANCLLESSVKTLFITELPNNPFSAEHLINLVILSSSIPITDIEVFDINDGFIGIDNINKLRTFCKFKKIH
jgi:hypothetical protein